ncbi:glycosyltransferase family 2 protein, partial [Frankia sp. CIT1]|uniref:glycosyltransferase family 2 protein n=1 Tax=Frankia sp. CIT1 TaxID=2880974 RepID=UPI001EF59D97
MVSTGLLGGFACRLREAPGRRRPVASGPVRPRVLWHAGLLPPVAGYLAVPAAAQAQAHGTAAVRSPVALLVSLPGGALGAAWPLAAGLIVMGFLYLMAMLLLSGTREQPPAVTPSGLFYVFVMPCLNEEAVIGASVRRLLATARDDIRVLVVDDGSDDATASIVRGFRDERRWLLRRDPPNARSGKGAALNAAIAYLADHDEIAVRDPDDVIVVVVDADGRLDSHAIDAVAPYFSDPRTAGVQTGVRINNRHGNLLARMQDMEFVIYTDIFQRGRAHVDNVGLGGNGQFVRLSALRSLGPRPWSHSLTEDLDLGVRLLLAGWRNRFCAQADVHQQGVVKLRRLLRQRSRWFQGHLQSWRLIPQVIRDARIRTLPDMLFHLSSPLLIVLASLLTLAFGCSTAAVTADWLAGGPSPDPRLFVGAYLLATVPAMLCGLVYRRQEPISGFGLLRLIGYAHLYMVYALVWFVAGWWAIARILSGRNSWHKTARSPEERLSAAALTAGTSTAAVAASTASTASTA